MGGAPPPQGAYQGSQPYNMAGRGYNIGGTRITPARAIGLGCLILVIFFFLFSASCMRACFFPRRHTYIRRVF